jgi:hypothetical protein
LFENMPKVILSVKKGVLPLKDSVGKEIRTLVARAFSTEEMPLTAEDVDFIPIENPPGSIVADVSIEIEAIGYPQRVQKLSEEVAHMLKHDIAVIRGMPDTYASEPLIWIKFWNPAGLHV